MHRILTLGLFLLACISVHATTPTLGPIVVVAFENHGYASVMGSTGTSAMPYLHSLMSKGTLTTSFYAQAWGSVPDYFMITTGNTVSCCTSYVGPYTGNNLARVLNGAGKTWKVYAQGLPYAGYLGTGYYPYVKYHVPFAYFSDVVNSSTQKARIAPLSALGADVGNLPSFSLIVPDNRHNSHDCPNGVSNCTDFDKLHAADLFLQRYIPGILSSSQFQANGLLIIWWDEGSGGSLRTANVFVGPQVKVGYRSGVFYKDANMLRTIVEGLHGGSYPGASASAAAMADIFVGTSSGGGGSTGSSCSAATVGVTICTPGSGATVSSPFTISAAAKGNRTITAMKAYLDYSQVGSSSGATLSVSATAGSGSHSLIVNAWDTAGTLYQAKESFKVQ